MKHAASETHFNICKEDAQLFMFILFDSFFAPPLQITMLN